jgi:hypothetical protein
VDVYPGIEVKAGEHVILRFEFDEDRHYNGFVFFFSEHAYREYHLPDSGFDKAFGIGGSRTTVISLWNSGSQTEHYHFSMIREPGNDLNINGGLFANLSISEFEPQALPIDLESLIPYRATVSSSTGGWLETFVLFLPGYRAWVDGVPAPVVKSSQSLAEVSVPPGRHSVELRFVGTVRLWLAAFVSVAGWVTLCALWVARGKTKIRV